MVVLLSKDFSRGAKAKKKNYNIVVKILDIFQNSSTNFTLKNCNFLTPSKTMYI